MKIRPKEIRMSSHKAAREKIAKLNGFFAPKREERRIPPHIPPPHSHNIPTYVHIQKRAFAGESRDVTFPGEIRTYLYHLQKPERSRFHCSAVRCLSVVTCIQVELRRCNGQTFGSHLTTKTPNHIRRICRISLRFINVLFYVT